MPARTVNSKELNRPQVQTVLGLPDAAVLWQCGRRSRRKTPIHNSANWRTWKNSSNASLSVYWRFSLWARMTKWWTGLRKTYAQKLTATSGGKNVAYVALLFVGASHLPRHSSRQDDSCHLMPHLWYNRWIRGSYPPVRSCTWNRHLMRCSVLWKILSRA